MEKQATSSSQYKLYISVLGLISLSRRDHIGIYLGIQQINKLIQHHIHQIIKPGIITDDYQDTQTKKQATSSSQYKLYISVLGLISIYGTVR